MILQTADGFLMVTSLTCLHGRFLFLQEFDLACKHRDL